LFFLVELIGTEPTASCPTKTISTLSLSGERSVRKR
jgi:hypothetical protein